MTKTSRPVAGLTGLILLATGCSGPSTTSAAGSASGAGSGLAGVVFLGDSVAVGEALPLNAALTASNVPFRSLAADGGGNVVGPFSDRTVPKLPAQFAAAKPSVVIYQITTYDWGSEREQRAGYGALLSAATAAGAKLVFVTMPPIKADDFYRPHLADLSRAPGVAGAVAQESSGRAHVVDAGAVWGSTYRPRRDGKADRSTDGIHTCPQGAARFTVWLLGELAKLYPGFAPANPKTWANTGWATDRHFTGC
jgi:hypothetical protein